MFPAAHFSKLPAFHQRADVEKKEKKSITNIEATFEGWRRWKCTEQKLIVSLGKRCG